MRTPLIILFAFVFFVAFAQDKKEETSPLFHYAADITVSYSIALGKYNLADREDEKSGYAANGYLIQGSFDWMGKKSLGLCIQYSFQHNPYQKEAENINPEGRSDSLGTTGWSNHYLMVGPVFIKSWKKITLDVKVLGGFMVAIGSNFYYVKPADNSLVHDFGSGFALQISGAVGYNITKNLTLKGSLGWLGAWPVKNKEYEAEFLGYKEEYDPVSGKWITTAVYSAPVTYNIKKVISTFNPGIGLVFRF
jgi:hypothetical protein